MVEAAKERYQAVDVNFGDEELEAMGTTKITKEIFEGTQDKTEKAIVFVENLEKTQKNTTKPKKSMPRLKSFHEEVDVTAEWSTAHEGSKSSKHKLKCNYDSDINTIEEETQTEQVENVIINISPKKYDKPRDQLFIDFFSMYTRTSVQETLDSQRKQQNGFTASPRYQLKTSQSNA